MATMGNVIRTLRQERGLTQSELARQVGVPQSRLSRIETRQRPVSAALLAGLAGTLGVSVEELYLQAGLVPGREPVADPRCRQLQRLFLSLPERNRAELLARLAGEGH